MHNVMSCHDTWSKMHTIVDREGDTCTCIEREEVAYISVCVHPVVEAVSVSGVRL